MTDTDDLVDNLDGVRVLGIKTSDIGIGLTRFDHHHAKIVALEHLIVSLLEGITLTLVLFRQDAGVTFTALLLRRMAQVNNLDAFKRKVKSLC